MAQSKINYATRPMPSGPGAKQITVEGQMSRKGGAPFVSKMPTKHVIPGDMSSTGVIGSFGKGK